MKQFLRILFFLCLATGSYAQNATEAKMAYQMAEEKFDAKQYTEALAYLEKAETALGSTNPPMAYLKVIITNQIFDLSFGKAGWQNALENLEKELINFEQTKNKEALADDKLMNIYRIKQEIEGRAKEYEMFWTKESIRIDAFNTFFETFPKVGIHINDFFQHPYAKLWRGFESFKTIIESFRKGHESQINYVAFDNALNLGEPFFYYIKTNTKGIVTEYMMKIEYKEPSVTKSDFISSIQMPEIYIEAFEPVEGNFFYNKNLKGYQLKQKNPQYNLVVDNRVKKTEDKYKRDGRRKYIDFIDVYVKLEEQP